MPRVSSAALSVVKQQGLETFRRPTAPYDLTAEQAEIWRDIVESSPPDWFPAETYHILIQYCRLISRARVIAAQVNAMEKTRGFKSDKYYLQLLKIEMNLSQCMKVLATSMRLTQNATMRKAYAIKPAGMTLTQRKPWDKDDEE